MNPPEHKSALEPTAEELADLCAQMSAAEWRALSKQPEFLNATFVSVSLCAERASQLLGRKISARINNTQK